MQSKNKISLPLPIKSWRSAILFSIFFYCTLWIWQGIDVTDEGFHLSNAWLMRGPHITDYDLHWTVWLTYIAGGYWLDWTDGFGMIGARFGWVLLVSILAWVSYSVFAPKLGGKKAYLLIALTMVAILHRGFPVINYYNFPSFLLIGAVSCLIFSQKCSARQITSIRWSILGGFILGLGIMSRLPYILTLFFPVVPPILLRIFTGKWHHFSWKLALISLISAGVAILLSLFYLHQMDFFQNYIGVLQEVFFDKQPAVAHSKNQLLRLTLLGFGKSIVVGLLTWSVCFVLVLLGKVCLPNQKGFQIIFFATGLLAVIVMLRVFTSTAGFHLLLWGTCLIGAIGYLLVYMRKGHYTQNQIDDFMLLIMGLLCIIFGGLGSTGPIHVANYTLALILPFLIWKLPILLEDLSSMFPRLSISLPQAKQYSIAFLCVLAFGGFMIRFTNPYRESANRFALIEPLSHDRLKGVLTSQGRAESLNQLFEKVGHLTKPGDTILAYQAIPMIHFVTQTFPALETPWPESLKESKLNEKFTNWVKSKPASNIIVRTKISTRERTWGNQPPSERFKFPPALVRLNNRLKPLGYRVIWSNADFEILSI